MKGESLWTIVEGSEEAPRSDGTYAVNQCTATSEGVITRAPATSAQNPIERKSQQTKLNKYNARVDQAASALFLSLFDRVIPYLGVEKNPHGMWTVLKRRFDMT